MGVNLLVPRLPVIGEFVAVDLRAARAVILVSVDTLGMPTNFGLAVTPKADYDIETVGEGNPRTLGIRLRNLYPGTRYTYRLIALNEDGTSVSAEQALSTEARSPLLPTPYVAGGAR